MRSVLKEATMSRPENNDWTETFPGVRHRWQVTPELGAGAVTMGTVAIAPGKEIPPHTHPVEDAMVITQGHGQFLAGDDVHQIEAGSSCLAPANVVHGVRNTGDEELVLVFTWPAVNVRRVMADVQRET